MRASSTSPATVPAGLASVSDDTLFLEAVMLARGLTVDNDCRALSTTGAVSESAGPHPPSASRESETTQRETP
ncbi:hypothetical protein ACN47A_18815 [Myxococcus fulvus]|uniref:hypothetical protein n=1 Tax=Myxococcus fulvus TaxID=33 RepID=UPI003B9CC223